MPYKKRKPPKRVGKKTAKKKTARKKTAKRKMKKKAAKRKTKKRSGKKRSRSEIGKASKAKGARGEVYVAKRLKELWPDTEDAEGRPVERVKRNYQDRGGVRDGPDIAAPGLSGEVKHRSKPSFLAAIEDAEANCLEGTAWFAVDWATSGPHRGKRRIVMDFDAWIEFIKDQRIRANARGFEEGYSDGFEEGYSEAQVLAESLEE